MDATSTLTSGARILAATRVGVQRHRRPYSIKSRDKLAMVVASAGRANRNDSSELVMRYLSPKSMGAIKFCADGAAAVATCSKFRVQCSRLKSDNALAP